jgi:hypothetical protein
MVIPYSVEDFASSNAVVFVGGTVISDSGKETKNVRIKISK